MVREKSTLNCHKRVLTEGDRLLEDLTVGLQVEGLAKNEVAKIIQVQSAGADARLVYYQTPSGVLASQTLYRENENGLSAAVNGLAWAFDAPADKFKLALEAWRISQAHLFDPMMAVHASNVEPLPHQISAVYEIMLNKHPLRFVLADDPGAGKTVMAGLLIKELMLRGDVKRVLVVAPGSLTEQWQDEMRDKFALDFRLFSNAAQNDSLTGNLFHDEDRLIARVDMLSRSDEHRERLKAAPDWDLIIVDEAHKMSAHPDADGVIKKTLRYSLGELLGSKTRHFLLMTATPHNGKDEDFHAWMALLDPDRFCGKRTRGDEKPDVADLMRRLVKEELCRFDGTRLFPPRFAYTVSYALTPAEQELYESVTEYVRQGMNLADRLAGGKKNCIGFALTLLQRRLASSPAAIHKSIQRRIARLEKRLDECRHARDGEKLRDDSILAKWERTFSNADFDEDDLTGKEQDEEMEEALDAATAAQSIPELEEEIRNLKGLELQARQVLNSKEDTKWTQLRSLFDDDDRMYRDDGSRRKLIVFTEHKDTLEYLAARLTDHLGRRDAVVTISGSTPRDQRRAVQNEFRNNSDVLVLIATDAAGEGVNLQNTNLMVNYDMPWNPNRLEQRFGRIHRIGQTETCHLWNMVAAGTREGDVFQTLLDKLEAERQALGESGGRVFDILGEALSECSLKDLLLEAIRKGETPEAKNWMKEKVDTALDTERLRQIMARNSLVAETMDDATLFRIRDQMDRAEARKLQPCYVRDFFQSALEFVSGSTVAMRPREKGRFQIPNVPRVIRDNPILRNSRDSVATKYDRICFDRAFVRVDNSPLEAEFIHPGHPLMRSLTELVLKDTQSFLKPGTVMVDPLDDGVVPSLLFMIDHSVRDSAHEIHDPAGVISRRLQFVRCRADGTFSEAGWAPHLDLEAADASVLAIAREVRSQPWLTGDLESQAQAFASEHLAKQHYEEVKERRLADIQKQKEAVRRQLVSEIDRCESRAFDFRFRYEQTGASTDKASEEKFWIRSSELKARLNARMAELAAEEEITSGAPVILGGILVIPRGLLNQRTGAGEFCADAQARSRIERLAMDAVWAVEVRRGNIPIDISAEKCGWDITSRAPMQDDHRHAPDLHIEVKGRVKGSTTVTVSRNEVLTAINQADKFILAVCLIDGDTVDGPYYVRRPFEHEMEHNVVSQNYDLASLLEKSEKMS